MKFLVEKEAMKRDFFRSLLNPEFDIRESIY